ncbi:branched-chain amino acid ABC transporter permease [Marinobacter algicola]|uniref:branched-chain amino acid ABC transporter permease n=1 Tax=Marinobacter algicola TaxID=236100 RepID=UPI003BA9E0EE
MQSLPRSIQILLIVLTLLLVFYPMFGEALVGDKYDYYLQKLTTIMILAIMAVSLDLLVGVAGMVSVAHAAFFGVAGYTLALMAPEYAAPSVWIALPLSLGVAALTALIMGALIIRTSGIFFIMVTIAFSQMLFYLLHDAPFAGGSDGIFLMFKPEVAIAGVQLLDLSNRATLFYVVLTSLILVYLLLRTLLRSPFGRVLFSINENEVRVQALGYNPLAYKLVAFVIAGTVSGYAGFLSATQYGFVNPVDVSWMLSAHTLFMVILGGMGTLFGAILGAFAFEGLHYWYSSMTIHWELLMGITVILMVLLLPKGIAGLLLQLDERWQRRRRGDEPEPAPIVKTKAEEHS